MSAKNLYDDLCKRLKTDTVWTKEQAELYETLKLLLHEHSLCKKFYKVNMHHKDYIDFMNELDWYKQDKDKLYVNKIIKSCVLLENPINNSQGIKIILFFKELNIKLNGFYDKKLDIFYIYFSKDKNNEIAYVTYYNTHKDTRIQADMRLPEFEKIYNVTGFLDTMLKRGSLIKFIVDTLRFYGCELLLLHNVGIRYNITLDQIYNKIHT